MKLYPNNIFEVTEFDKIKSLLESLSDSLWAKNASRKLKPTDNKDKISKYQEQSWEYFKIINLQFFNCTTMPNLEIDFLIIIFK